MEFEILCMIQALHCTFLDYLMKFVSFTGNGGVIWIIAGVVMLFFNKTRKCGVSVLLSLIFCLLIGNVLLKNIFMRQRPCWIDKSVPLLINVPKDYSFPSGHTLSSFASGISIFRFNKKIGVFALIYASLIAFSRLYLFVHFPTDVIGAIILGIINSYLALKTVSKFYP